MIALSPALTAFLLNNRNYALADLFTFFLLNGNVLRYTSAAIPITFESTTWVEGLRINRGKIHLKRGTEVDSLDVDTFPNRSDMIGGNTFAQLVTFGGLDGCYVQLDRAFLPNWKSPVVGIVPKRFYGRVADINIGRSKITITIKSDLDLLNIQMPRVLFQPPCSHSLYDGGCTLIKAAFTVSGAVAGTGQTTRAFQTTLSAADGYFGLGVIAFTSGANDGLSRTVRTFLNADGATTITLALPNPPAVGDTFTIYPGCDKTFPTCAGKFSNGQNFRGFPYVPPPETAFL